MEWKTDDKTIKLLEGDLVSLDVDAIVNAANTSLILGGGVAGAIRSNGGPTIQEECNRICAINVGDAVLTSGGNLKAKYVIHAAGPVYGEGNEDRKLSNAVNNSLLIARKKEFNSVAFPAISAGIFHFPMKKCSEIILKEAMMFLKKNDYPKEIIICLYGEKTFQIFKDTLITLKQKD